MKTIPRTKHYGQAIALGLAAALVLAGCSSAGAPDNKASDGASAKTIDVKLGGVPVTDLGYIVIGQEQGFFEDAGVNVGIEYAGGSTALVPALINGQYDIIWGGLLTGLRAVDKGLPLKVIALSSKSTGVKDHDLSGILSLKGSGINGPADLAGKKVAVNEIDGPHQVQDDVLLHKLGVDYSTVKYVELPMASMEQALRAGQVDAVTIPEPFLTAAIQAGGVQIVASTPNAWSSNVYTSGFYVTDAKLASDPDMVKRFLEGLHKAYDLAASDPDVLRKATASITKISPDVLPTMAFPANGWEGQADAVREYAEAISAVGAIPGAKTAEKLIAPVMP